MEVQTPGHRRSSLKRLSQGDRSSRTSFDNGSLTNLLHINETKESSSKHLSVHKSRIIALLNSQLYSVFITTLTIYALFGDDIRLSATSKSSDSIFFSLTIVCIVIFSAEIIISSFAQDQYFFKFFFWLDLIATVSLISDIGWIWDPIVGTSDSVGKSAAQATQIARAGRASRAGTRAGRIIRIIRVIRLIRIVKLYKISQIGKKTGKKNGEFDLVRGSQNFRGEEVGPFVADYNNFLAEENIEEDVSQSFLSVRSEIPIEAEADGKNDENRVENNNVKDFSVPEESKIGKNFSNLTTKRVIILVLIILFFLPLFYPSLYLNSSITYDYGLELIKALKNTSDYNKAWTRYINEHKSLSTPLIYLEIKDGDKWTQSPSLSKLRQTEIQIYTIDSSDFSIIAIFDFTSRTHLEAWLNISRTVFVCLVLVVSSIYLTKDAQELVIEPIENMLDIVRKISENPLKAVQEEENKKLSLQLAKSDSNKAKKNKKDKNSLETIVLQQTLSKIGALLALGFGEAGSEIISLNMQRVGGEVDPMISGKKTYCIFGFCDIRNFTQTTEVLQQNILTFVNEIAYLVHRTVDYHSGFANKNIGDTFLLVWKFPEKLLNRNEETRIIELAKDRMVSQIADLAVVSFIKILIEINSNEKILKYRRHPDLIKYFSGFSVNMGFGLHQGWAIEGAIGSEFKIDASYLSPNVNLASRLEAATKQFGVQILISEAMWTICSKYIQTQFRKVDRVTVKGSQMPLDLYTCDLDFSVLQVNEEGENIENPEIVKLENKAARDWLMEQVASGGIQASSLFEKDPQIVRARSTIPKRFFKTFASALDDYLAGSWVEAKAGFIKSQETKGSIDGPCMTLLQYIEDLDLIPPDTWQGHRVLNDK